MDETTLDSEYLKQLKPKFIELFREFVKPCNVLSLFHKYNINVLTENDVENINALSDKKGNREGSMLLFERLVLYKGWYACLLQVLRDRDVCLSHVAHEMEVFKGLLDEKILSEESGDQTLTTYQWLAGMSVLTSGLTTVLRVTPHTTNLNNLKVDPILEMRSLKLKVELERVKKELDEIKKSKSEQIQSFEQQLPEPNYFLSSDSSDVDQVAGKMCELCKTSKEMLKQNEILQTELNHLREAYSDSKAFCEKLKQEKDVLQTELQTELDHLKKKLSDRKDSDKKLHQEKEKLQTEFDKLKQEFCDSKASCEKLYLEKDEIAIELQEMNETLTEIGKEKENEENKNKQLETIVREKQCALQQYALEKAELEDKLKAFHHENTKLKNKLDASHRVLLKKSNSEQKLKGSDQAPCAEDEIVADLKKELATTEKKCQPERMLNPPQTNQSGASYNGMLLLVGRTGNGKSSVGNTLLCEPRFHVSRGDSPDDHEIKWEENGNIKIVDGSRIGDTGEDMPGGVEASIRRAEEAFGLCGGGFNALLFCLRYGDKFTKKEKDAVQLVKALFGDGVFRTCGVIILTYGDNFELDGDVTFNEWVYRQQGDFRALVNECGGRCFLLNNRSQDKEQGMDIIAAAHQLPTYTEAEFNAANGSRQLLIEPPPVPDSQDNKPIYVHKIYKGYRKGKHQVEDIMDSQTTIARVPTSMC